MRRKILFLFVSLFALFLMQRTPAFAATPRVAGASASLFVASKNTFTSELIKKKALYNVLARHNSPMAQNVQTFVDVSSAYHLDLYLLPAIAGVESSFGQAIYPGTYNPFGWGGGMIYFKDWNNAITLVGKGIREHYINNGAVTIEDIGYIYAAGSTTWAPKVRYFMRQFEFEEQKLTAANPMEL